MTTSTLDPETDRPLKARHRAMWASGDYPLVAREAAARAGVHVEWREADAEAMPFDDAAFEWSSPASG